MIRGPYLVFRRGGERFAIPLHQVETVKRLNDCQTVPNPSHDVLGLIGSNGQIFTLIRTQLPPPAPASGDRPRYILVQGEAHFGFLADSVEGPKEADDKALVVVDLESHPANAVQAQVVIGGQKTWLLNVEAMVLGLESQ